MAEQYVRVLNAMAADPGQTVGQVDILGTEERRRILQEWNETYLPYSRIQTATINKVNDCDCND
jgi:hypothetical protein